MQRIRLEELDLLRGLSVIGMILVITPGAWGVGYSWLAHADWEGVVAVDMIAPAFMFCMGFAIPLALKSRIENNISTATIVRQVIQRGGLLILIGVFVNWAGNQDLSTLRLPGVLQRIGLTYIAVSLLILFLSRRGNQFLPDIKQLSYITAGLLIGLWAFFYFVPVPGSGANQFTSDGSWSSYLDKAVFGVPHMWEWGQTNGVVTYDPDGLICSLATCGNVLIGAILGIMFQQGSGHYTKKKLLMIGSALILVGFAFSFVCPIIKKIWTSSFVLVSSGVSVLTFVMFWVVKDNKILNRAFHPLYSYGANPLFGFVISWLGLFWFLNISLIGDQSIRNFVFEIFSGIWTSKNFASLMFGISFIMVLYAVLAYMYRKKWFIKL